MVDFNLADAVQALSDSPCIPNEIDISSMDAGEINFYSESCVVGLKWSYWPLVNDVALAP